MVNTQGEHTSTSLTTGTTSRTTTTVATFGVCVLCQCAQLLVDHGHVLVARDVTRAKTKARCTTGWTITKRVKRVKRAKEKQQVQVKYRQKLK